MTELLNQLEPGSAEAARLREGVLKTSQELSGSLDRAVGAVKPENDTLENLAGFLAAYAPSLLAPHGVECELDLPAQLPPVPLHGDTRQHLFLAVNEALNNIARHAQARHAWLRVTWREPQFEIVIEDDGMGLSMELARAGRPLGGNGLRNQRERLARLDGELSIEPRAAGGTTVRIRLPLAGASWVQDSIDRS